MAAGTAFSALFRSTSTAALPVPIADRPVRGAQGLQGDGVTYVIATTGVDDALDFNALIPVQEGKLILGLTITMSGTLGGSAANDCDLILRTYNPDGTVTDTMLYDSSAQVAFTAAIAGKTFNLGAGIRVPATTTGFGVIGLLCNTPGGTPASATITLNATWR